MSEAKSKQQRDQQQTQTLISYLRRELSESESLLLEKQLKEDDRLREKLLEISAEEFELIDWAKAEHMQSGFDKVFDDVKVPHEVHEPHQPHESHQPHEENHTITSTKTVTGSKTILASIRQNAGIAAAIFLTGIMSFIIYQSAGREHLSQSVTPISQGMARVVHSRNSDWSNETLDESQPLPAGDYQLTSGSVDLEFIDGARVGVTGPASFTIKDQGHIHVNAGKLVARVPDEAIGFVVSSPVRRVVDLGTEFGLTVNDSGQTEVHVLDGYVEVLSPEMAADARQGKLEKKGIFLAKGQAMRFESRHGKAQPIPASENLFGKAETENLGFKILRGSVRVVDHISEDDLHRISEGRNWIDMIPERQRVTLSNPITVTIREPGSYRQFVTHKDTLPAGTHIDSYLLHFRPRSTINVKGVIRFNQPIVAIICEGTHIRETDDIFEHPSVYYPKGRGQFRGLEPHAASDFKISDTLVLSQDRRTLGIDTYAGIEQGYDQIRVLTQASE